MKKFNWEDFKNYKCGVHCKTSEEAQKFIELASKQGMKWTHSGIYETNWKYNKADTYYAHKDNLKYGNINANLHNLPVFDFSDSYNKLCCLIDLIEDGMIVETADLRRYLVLTKDGQRILSNYYMYIPFDRYDKELHYYNQITGFPVPNHDIIAIYKMSCNTLGYLFDDDEEEFQEQAKVIWEREDIEFMTLEQVCKKLSKKIKIKED